MHFLGHPKVMYDMNVRGVVNMCSEYSGPVSDYKKLGIKQLRLPSVDHYEPDFKHMQDAVLFIEECKRRKEKVYIHCKAGHGRAASIALCWLIHSNRDRTAEVCCLIFANILTCSMCVTFYYLCHVCTP